MRVHPANINYINSNIYNGNERTDSCGINTASSSDTIFDYLRITGNYNLTFSGSKRAFYSINQNGEYQKFTDRKTAEETLSLAKTNIAECLQGKRNMTHGYSFVYADEIETTNENGETVVDKIKLDNKIQQITTALEAQDKPVPIYAIDKSGNCKKYPSKYQAEKTLGTGTPHIIMCLNKQIKKTGGYAFVFPEEIETTDNNGKTVIDKNKVQEVVYSAFEENTSTPVYAIHKNGEYRKYLGVRKAARELSLESANISSCLNGGQKRVGDYTFARAEDVEIVDVNKNVSVDTVKIKEINKQSMIHESYVPVYAIGADGSWVRYDNKGRAAKALDIDMSSLTHCLKGRYNVVQNHSFAYAEEMETMDKKGNVVINYDKLKEKYDEVNKNAIYAVYKDGQYKKYATQTEAAKELGLSRTKIVDCINGISTKVAGRTFVRADYVESFDKGILTINETLLKKFALELANSEGGGNSVYAFDSEGNYQKYDSVSQSAKILNIPKTRIKHCLSGQQKSSGGYRFIYAREIENNVNGETIVDYDKLDKISEEINSSIKKRMKKFGKIYALKGYDILEFSDIRKASRALGIKEETIIYYLNHGLNPENNKNSINGFVFACEKDKIK